jgi:sarcosine oxidase subunit alpha
MTTRQWNPVALTAMHHRHLAAGATMAVRNGWMRAARYTSADAELELLRKTAGISDVSHRGKLRIQGKDVPARLAAIGLPDLQVGRVARVPLKMEGGQLTTTVARLAADDAAVTTGSGQAPRVADLIGEAPCAHLIDVSSALACVRAVGPLAHRLLASLTEVDLDPDAFGDLHCLEGRIADVHGMVIRADVGAIPSYEFYYGREFGQHVWDALVEAGKPIGAAPVGFEALIKIGS